jgi:A/G-specific adenine glycosylase
MLENYDLKQLVEPALQWYQLNKRELPWRQDREPYHVWVSEIMLQQTRVEAVIPYYERFMKELPDIAALAACPEDKLLKLWEGLGYYNRVRNMQKAAQCITEHYGGVMPADYETIRGLPGIGPYTAGAIASIAFGEPVPAVDGNVLRILCRVSEDDSDILKDSTKKKVSQALQQVMPKDAGSWNQALMEIGALVCIPNGEPKCGQCPWQQFCLATRHHTYDVLPVKKKANPRRIEEKTVLIIRDGEKILIRKRPKKGLLAGLYELPNLEGHLEREEILAFAKAQKLEPLHIEALPEAKHIFSHIEWHMTGYMVRVADVESFRENEKVETEFPQTEDSETIKQGYLLVDVAEIQRKYAIPSAFEKYMEYVNILLGVS